MKRREFITLLGAPGAGDARDRHPDSVATGIDHATVGILARAMQSMAVRGFIEHDHESGTYVLTDRGPRGARGNS